MYERSYEAFHRIERERLRLEQRKGMEYDIFANISTREQTGNKGGFFRMAECRRALEAIDRQGWERSYHQKQFHEDFIRASARVFWKTESAGQFQRDHQHILEWNGWDHLAQEILVSTPRRFGKTISVSMFGAAVIFSAPSIQMSIYSTCKRISQKILENVYMFLRLIYKELGISPMRELRRNMEQMILQGPEGENDRRVINSYPSRVCYNSLSRSLFAVFRRSTLACSSTVS